MTKTQTAILSIANTLIQYANMTPMTAISRTISLHKNFTLELDGNATALNEVYTELCRMNNL